MGIWEKINDDEKNHFSVDQYPSDAYRRLSILRTGGVCTPSHGYVCIEVIPDHSLRQPVLSRPIIFYLILQFSLCPEF